VRYLLIVLLFLSFTAQAQLLNAVEVSQKLEGVSEADVKTELLHIASMKSVEKFAPEMGYKFDEFQSKLDEKFEASFKALKERKLVEKFGKSYKETLTEEEKSKFLQNVELEKHAAFIRFSQSIAIIRSHKIENLAQKEAGVWTAKIDLDVDKTKLERLFRRVINNESKPFAKVFLITEITPLQFSWPDLGLETETSFINPLNDSWIKWLNENGPSTVEEIVMCDASCMSFYSSWSESHADNLNIPEEYAHSVFLKVSLFLKRTSMQTSVKESSFEWEGRSLIQDVGTKKIMGSFTLPTEARSFRQPDQKAMNSSLASSLYRSPISAFMYFRTKLEEKIGFNRVTRLVITGQHHLGDVLALGELLKTRGSSLGLEVFLASFSKDEANVICYYKGEEKSFTDLLSSIKELKSSHSYTLVNEFTGVHHVLKLVTE
jgi:hypothetical protein